MNLSVTLWCLFFLLSQSLLGEGRKSGGSHGKSGGSHGKSGGSIYTPPRYDPPRRTQPTKIASYPKSPARTHTYPASNTGLSGNNYHHPSSGNVYIPSIHQSPVYVHIDNYRKSDSSYGKILTGLTLYNLGRSHSHHHDYYNHHYYDDEYYHYHSRHNYNHERDYQSRDYQEYQGKQDEEDTMQKKVKISCNFRIEEDNKVSRVRIPCEIISNLTPLPESDDTNAKKVTASDINEAKCLRADGRQVTGSLSNGTLVNAVIENGKLINGTVINAFIPNLKFFNASNTPVESNTEKIDLSIVKSNVFEATEGLPISTPVNEVIKEGNNINNIIDWILSSSFNPDQDLFIKANKEKEDTGIASLSNEKLINPVIENGKGIIGQSIGNNGDIAGTLVNCTAVGQGTMSTAIDPLDVRGSALVVNSHMKCVAEMRIGNKLETHSVDCGELEKLSEKEDAKESPFTPSKEQYKSWISKPPAWLAFLFIV